MDRIQAIDFQAIFNTTPGLYLILSKDLTIVAVNNAYLNATLTKREAIVGHGLFEIFPDNPNDESADGVSNLRDSLNFVLKNLSPHKMAIQKYDIRDAAGVFEERFWSPLNTPVLNSENEVIYIIHRVEDVTEFIRLKQEENQKEQMAQHLQSRVGEMEIEIIKSGGEIQKLNETLEQKIIERTQRLVVSETQFRTTLDLMREGIQIIGFDWRYLYVNDTIAKQAKYSKEELLNHTIMEKYPGIEKSEFYKVIERCMYQRIPHHIENEFTYPDNSKSWFELSIQPVPEGTFILSIDITDRKKGEEAIRQLNRNLEEKVTQRTNQLEEVHKELESFSYAVSHDLRAPLRAINGYAKMLDEDFSEHFDNEGKRLLEVIQHNAKSMGVLIDDLLNLSRLGKKKLVKTSVDMLELTEAAIHELKKTTEWNAHIQIDQLPTIRGDYGLLNQVMINLISNAIKYSSKKENAKIEIKSEVKDDAVTFSVIDNGSGFDMRYYDKLFGVFQRLHNSEEFEGTGVGLALVKRIIKKHKGKIWAEAAVGKGATFYFTLPFN